MAPIRKGDGTPLEIPGVSEVRSGDGRVFFDGDAIPDTVRNQYSSLQLTLSNGTTVDPYSDAVGELDLSPVGSPTFTESDPNLNDRDSVVYDGTDDAHVLSSAEWDTLQQPFTIIAVVNPTDGGDRDSIVTRESTDDPPFFFDIRFDDNVYELFAGSAVFGGTPTEDVQLLTGIVDGPDSALRKNGSEIATGDVGTADLESISVCAREGDSDFLDGPQGITEFHTVALSGTDLTDREDAIASKFGIDLS